MRTRLLIAAAALAAVSLSTTDARAFDLEAGGVLGGNYSRLSQPRDLEGEPTLLQGSRFTGFGVHFGGTGRWNAMPLDFADLVVDASLLVAFQNGSGFVENAQTGARRDVNLSLINLRIPITAGVRYALTDGAGLALEVGPELLFGLRAASEVTEFNTGNEPTPLDVGTAAHLGLTVGAEFDFRPTDTLIVPISLRYAFDPFVPKKTVDRFDGFVSEQEPGAFTVAFDHMVLLSVGVRLGL